MFLLLMGLREGSNQGIEMVVWQAENNICAVTKEQNSHDEEIRAPPHLEVRQSHSQDKVKPPKNKNNGANYAIGTRNQAAHYSKNEKVMARQQEVCRWNKQNNDSRFVYFCAGRGDSNQQGTELGYQ